jgi:hypothetical protein
MRNQSNKADYLSRLCQHGRWGKKYFPFVGGARGSTSGGPLFAMSERTNQLITICMLISALAMVGWVMSGTLQMSRLPVAQVATK